MRRLLVVAILLGSGPAHAGPQPRPSLATTAECRIRWVKVRVATHQFSACSNMIGAMRSGAQIISYELSVGLSLLTIIVLAGTMQFSRPGKFRWEYDKPYEQLIVGDGGKLWIYDRDLNQVIVRKLDLALGYSHPILMDIPEGIKITVTDQTKVKVEGADKQLVGAVTAEIRGYYPPEPYKGKGIHYLGEKIRRKAGKSGKGGKAKK